MTHQYESEILNKLMERDGFNIPSSVPPYESEIKAYLIEQVKLAYPKLNDYEAEWLLYNYTKHIPAEFPLETITNVTDATVNNVVPYAYKSAILKGNTLVNIVNNDNWVQGTGADSNLFTQNISIKKGQTYTVIGKMESSDVFDESRDAPAFRVRTGTNNSVTSLLFIQQSDVVIKQTFTNNENDTIHLRFFNQKTNYKKLMIIEGDYTNVDIPYFEGMQSVKLPVLTTTGKNLFDVTKVKKGYTLNSTTGLEEISNRRYVTDYINVENATFIAITNQQRCYNIWGYDSNKVPVTKLLNAYEDGNKIISIPNNVNYIRIPFAMIDQSIITDDIINNTLIQIEYGENLTPYEPYKSNILTVNEDVTLRSNGDICDELNLLTGQLTQRIGEDGVVLSQESVKTVDLSVVDENGNEINYFMPIEGTMRIQTDGEPIKPSVTMEIPVEATTQNLASFIEMEV